MFFATLSGFVLDKQRRHVRLLFVTKRQPRFSVKAVSLMTGLTPDVLRAWERRHGVVSPGRAGNSRRFYTEEDVERLRLLADAVRRGNSIGTVARLDNAELTELLTAASTETPIRTASRSGYVDTLMTAVEEFDTTSCERSLGMAFATMPVREVIDEIIFPVLAETGARWRRGDLTIAQERLISTVVRRIALNLLTSSSSPGRRPRIIFATPPGESHELGALLAALDASTSGVSSEFVGTDLPGREIARIADQLGADVVALSIIEPASLDRMAQEIHDVTMHSTRGVELWIGGPAAARLRAELGDTDARYLENFSELRRRLTLLSAAGTETETTDPMPPMKETSGGSR